MKSYFALKWPEIGSEWIKIGIKLSETKLRNDIEGLKLAKIHRICKDKLPNRLKIPNLGYTVRRFSTFFGSFSLSRKRFSFFARDVKFFSFC